MTPKEIHDSSGVADIRATVNQVTPWGGVQCDTEGISFWAESIIGWRSGSDCYKYGKEGLRKLIKKGDAQATYEMSANGNLLNRCHLGVKTVPFHAEEYVDCLNKEVKNSGKF